MRVQLLIGMSACAPNVFAEILFDEKGVDRMARIRGNVGQSAGPARRDVRSQRCILAALRSHGVTIANQARIAVSSDRPAE